MEVRQEYLLETINYFRKLDFFQNGEYLSLSNYELIKLLSNKNNIYCQGLKSTFESTSLRNFWYERDYISDIVVVSCDQYRIIHIATDVFTQCPIPEYSFERFCRTINSVSKISRGVFIPQNLTDIGNETVAFNCNNKIYELSSIRDCEDPLLISRQVNSIISDSGYQFEMFAAALKLAFL